jgi:hypothetical protein
MGKMARAGAAKLLTLQWISVRCLGISLQWNGETFSRLEPREASDWADRPSESTLAAVASGS